MLQHLELDQLPWPRPEAEACDAAEAAPAQPALPTRRQLEQHRALLRDMPIHLDYTSRLNEQTTRAAEDRLRWARLFQCYCLAIGTRITRGPQSAAAFTIEQLTRELLNASPRSVRRWMAELRAYDRTWIRVMRTERRDGCVRRWFEVVPRASFIGMAGAGPNSTRAGRPPRREAA